MAVRPSLLALPLIALVAGTAPAAVSPEQKALEARFDAGISSADQLEWLKRMASAPNHVGAPHNKANAEASVALFKSWGWDARLETFSVLYPTPISTTVELIAPDRIPLGGQETAVEGDATSRKLADALPPYVAYQGDGDVTGDVVYVNFGMPADYDHLKRLGIDVKGKIVVARYGAGWRGLKPLLAQMHGAIGCIIYSDPAQDGYAIGDTYPKGGARPPQGVQRGSVMDMPIYPGDPLTPGIGATEGAKRLTRETAPTILKIPVLPMGYGDAEKILSRLGGPVATGAMRGALPFTYHFGGDGGVQLRLAVKSEWKQRAIYDVVATLKGSTLPDEWIVRGNHHDGWVFGAGDPLSGNVAMLSEAKALGALVKAGWRPKRTIVYASWDGEEPALLGSTEWAETHAAELQKKAVIYINTDGNGRGFLGAQGSHGWQHLVNRVAEDVTDPETGASVADRLRANIRADAADGTGRSDPVALAAAEKGADLPIGPLGSGSDYTAFIQHLGIPSINLGYGGEDEGDGVYHSAYDSFDHFTRFDDPGLLYGAALSKTAGRLVLRIAEADTPPVRFADFATTVGRYFDEIRKLADDRRGEDGKRGALLADGSYRLASDPLKPLGAPETLAATPHVELAVLANAVDRLKAAATAYDAAYASKGAALPAATRTQLNAKLRDIDQTLLIAQGLPGRPWFRNSVYAPGRLTGYGAKTLPGVREAIEDRRFDDANAYARLTAEALTRYAQRLEEARALLPAG
ncbi:transferrin receptor-like dimerization domain-containing protein [Sphingomonas flavalba]|uniref:transferrin receptor-like dimerization domain-containing protein n=1 Tax=Sphingomonas flavalba TaxID=2559804 RepID=UPI00109DBB98|nr:transferrin receptor-like dimerization domain-containing protein [Sphingomonas flavalba]